MSVRRKVAVLFFAGVLAAGRASAQDQLAAARELYASAAYEEALALLDRLKQLDHGADEERAIQQYRAFCLLAIGRNADAEQAIEAVVAAQPTYQPSTSDVSPRIRTVFTEVRRRMLPTIIQQQYAIAKAAYDRKDYKEAAQRFNQMLTVMADPDVTAAASRPPLADLRVIASGFRDLSVAAATPPPLPSRAPEPPRPASVAAAAPAVPAQPRVYSANDPDVVPPIALRQTLPPFPTNAPRATQGVIEVIISEAGTVEIAMMRSPLNPTYDRQALTAARGWQYQPATVNGKPVKYRKSIVINVK
jgi:TonB family protein